MGVAFVGDERRCAPSLRVVRPTARLNVAAGSDVLRSPLSAAGYERRRRAAREPTVEPAPVLLAELEAAVERATDEVRLVAIVAAAAPTNWRAAAWLLSRRWPERWASRRPVDDEPTPTPARASRTRSPRSTSSRRAGDNASTVQSGSRASDGDEPPAHARRALDARSRRRRARGVVAHRPRSLERAATNRLARF